MLASACTLVFLLGCPGIEVQNAPNEAQALYERMKRKLLNAKTLHIESDVKDVASSGPMPWLLLREGNRVRLEGGDRTSTHRAYIITLSDGKKVSTYPSIRDQGQLTERLFDTPENYGERTIDWFAQFGCPNMVVLPSSTVTHN